MSDQPQGSGFSTLALHAGRQPAWHARRPDEAPFLTSDPAGDGRLRAGEQPGLVLEERIAALEGGSAAVAVGSGAAAILVSLHTLLRPGDSLMASRRLRTAAVHQLDRDAEGFGWRVDWVDMERPENVVDALGEFTRAIVIEAIGPAGEPADIEAVAAVAQRARLPLIVDNTLATPYLVRPFEHGADIVVHDAAAFLAGPGGADGGLIIDGGTFDWIGDERYPALSRPRRGGRDGALADVFGNFAFATACRMFGLRTLGAVLPPTAARSILDGIETLALRMQRQSDSALAVAQHLSRHHAVASVRYAGLDGDAGQARGRRAIPKGAGALLGVGLAAGLEAAATFVERLDLFAPADEMRGTRSLVFSAEADDPDIVRLSIGLEDTADIIADLDRALAP